MICPTRTSRWSLIRPKLFSKSFLGYTTYKVQFAAREGLLAAIALDYTNYETAARFVIKNARNPALKDIVSEKQKAALLARSDVGIGGVAIGGVIVASDFAESHDAAVVHRHRHARAGTG